MTFRPSVPSIPFELYLPHAGERWYVQLPGEIELRYVHITFLSEKVVVLHQEKEDRVRNFHVSDVKFVERSILELPIPR